MRQRKTQLSPDTAMAIAQQLQAKDAEIATLRTQITAYDIRMDNDAAEIARLRTELDQARADVEAILHEEPMSETFMDALKRLRKSARPAKPEQAQQGGEGE